MKLRFQSGARVRGGFSLVEVLCAIVILGVGLLGLVQGLTTALASQKEAEYQTAAAFLAAGRIEMIQADGFILAGEDSGDFDENPLYHWRQTIAETKIEGLFDIDIVVENSRTSQVIYELRTLLFDPPLLPRAGDGDSAPRSSSLTNRRKERDRR